MPIKKKQARTAPSAGSPASSEEALELAVRALKRRRGVSAWEVYLEEEESLSIEARDGVVESLAAARSRGMAARIVSNGRMGFGFTNNLGPAAIERMIGDAAVASRHLADAFPGFAPARTAWPALEILDPDLAAIPREEKIKRAIEIEAAAHAYDRKIKRVRGAEYEESTDRMWIVNSEGLAATSRSTLVSASVEAVAEYKGEAQAADEFETFHHYAMLDCARVGREAARKAVGYLGGRPIRSGTYPVILAPAAAAGLLSVLGPAACGDAVAKRRSWLADRRGKRVASPLVTIVDDGLMPGGPGTAPFDDEGTPSRKVVVIREGRLETFLYDAYYGAKARVGSTGNGMRSAYHLPPMVDTTNWAMAPGKVSEPELIADVKKGLLIQEFLGLHNADPVGGEFSVGAAGMWIERGKIVAPVLGVAVAGTIEELLLEVRAVGNQARFWGDILSPAVLIGKMDVSGQ